MEKLRLAWSTARVYLSKGAAFASHYAAIGARKTWVVLTRLPIALYSFARALADAGYADLLRDIYATGQSRAGAPLQPPALQQAAPDSALLLLGLFQKEGRFVDFLQEDVTGYSDQDIGTAARVVHQGCRRVLREHIEIQPVVEQPEGSRITLERGFDPAAVRPTGNVVGDPPFSGALVHRGWRAVETHLPQVANSRDVRILAAAEVEL